MNLRFLLLDDDVFLSGLLGLEDQLRIGQLPHAVFLFNLVAQFVEPLEVEQTCLRVAEAFVQPREVLVHLIHLQLDA